MSKAEGPQTTRSDTKRAIGEVNAAWLPSSSRSTDFRYRLDAEDDEKVLRPVQILIPSARKCRSRPPRSLHFKSQTRISNLPFPSNPPFPPRPSVVVLESEFRILNGGPSPPRSFVGVEPAELAERASCLLPAARPERRCRAGSPDPAASDKPAFPAARPEPSRGKPVALRGGPPVAQVSNLRSPETRGRDRLPVPRVLTRRVFRRG